MKNYDTRYSETKNIRRQSKSLAEERLSFMDGKRLGDLDIAIEGGATLRKVRRIIEKRVSQKYWKNAGAKDARTNYSRHATKRHLTNQMKNIYGYVPTGFVYCCAA